jgi:hypothetical protein
MGPRLERKVVEVLSRAMHGFSGGVTTNSR